MGVMQLGKISKQYKQKPNLSSDKQVKFDSKFLFVWIH